MGNIEQCHSVCWILKDKNRTIKIFQRYIYIYIYTRLYILYNCATVYRLKKSIHKNFIKVEYLFDTFLAVSFFN